MIVLDTDRDDKKPTSYLEAVEKARQYEFKALVKCMNDCFVELRLLAALAVQSDSDNVSAAKVREIADRYEDMSFEVMRQTIHKLETVKDLP